MMRWLGTLCLLMGLGSAHAAAPRWEDIPLPLLDQALVDTTGTLKPDTFAEVHQLAARKRISRVLRRGLLLPLFLMGTFVVLAVLGRRWDEAALRSDRFG